MKSFKMKQEIGFLSVFLILKFVALIDENAFLW